MITRVLQHDIVSWPVEGGVVAAVVNRIDLRNGVVELWWGDICLTVSLRQFQEYDDPNKALIRYAPAFKAAGALIGRRFADGAELINEAQRILGM